MHYFDSKLLLYVCNLLHSDMQVVVAALALIFFVPKHPPPQIPPQPFTIPLLPVETFGIIRQSRFVVPLPAAVY